MTADLSIEVWAGDPARRTGIGLRVGERLVLTSAAACPAAQSGGGIRWVAPFGASRRHACRLVWPGEAELADAGAVLLDIVDPDWSPRSESSTIRWGELTGRPSWVAGQVLGGPGTAALDVAVNRLAFGSARSWQLRIVAASPDDPAADPSPPGAPLVCRGLVTGIANWERDDGGERRLTGIPAATLLADAGFRELVAQATGTRPRPESVELAEVLCRWQPGTPPGTPADLLRPEYAVVPFHGPREPLDRLAGWCGNNATLSTLLLIGPPGQGKTRVARQLAEELGGEGWTAGVLGEVQPAGWLDLLAATDRPLLLIVERAAARTGQIAALLGDLAGRTTGHPVRLLLLDREAGPWWSRFPAGLGEDALAVEPEPIALPALPADAGDRDAEFARAAVALAGPAGRLPQPVEPQDPGRLRVPEPLRVVSPLPALTLHMAALAGLVGAGEEGPAAEAVVAAQLRSWERASGELPPELGRHWRRGVALAVLCRVEHRSHAVELLRRFAVPDTPEGTAGAPALADWLRELFPPVDGERGFWGTLRPDPVRAYYLAGVVGDPWLLESVLPELPALSDRLAELAIEAFADAAAVGTATGGTLAGRLAEVVAAGPATLGPIAVRLASRAGPGSPLLAVAGRLADRLAGRLADQSTSPATVDVEVWERIAAQLPDPAGPLAPLAVRLHRGLVAHHREVATSDPRTGPVRLAAALVASSAPLAELGRHEEAVVAAAEAVALCRATAATAAPALHRPRFVAALRVHAGRLVAAGRADQAGQALALLDEAREECRRLPDDEADRQLAEIAGGVGALARRYLAAVDLPAATEAAQHGLDICRGLVDRQGERHLPALRAALTTLGRTYREAGKPGDAVAALEEAVAVCRTLARRRSAGHLRQLAAAVDELSEALAAAGSGPAAAAASEQAVAVYRRLAAGWPVLLPVLASATRRLSDRLAAAGRAAPAVAAAEEATTYYGRLIQRDRRTYARSAADARQLLAIRLGESGDWKGAVEAGTEAVVGYRQLTGGDSAQRAPELAASLNNLSIALGARGWVDDGIRVGQDAVDQYRQLVDAGEAGYLPQLAAALNNLAVRLAQAARPAESLAAAEQAVMRYRQVELPGAGRVRDGYAAALATLSQLQVAAGRPGDALPMAGQAVALFEQLAGEDPDRYLPHHAASLLELAEVLAADKQWAHAGDTAASAVSSYRGIPTTGPYPDPTGLAAALRLLARCRSAGGRPEEAVTATEELVGLLRGRVPEHGGVGLGPLADALDALGGRYAAAGAPGRAVGAARESLALREQLAAADPRAHLPQLVAAWRALSRYLTEVGQPPGGEDLVAAERAEATSRRLASVDLSGYLSHLAPSLRLLAQRQAAAGLAEASEVTAGEAVSSYAHLARADPTRFQPDLAACLDELARYQAGAGHLLQSLMSTAGAVEAYRLLAGRDPRFRAALAGALTVRSRRSAELERRREALDSAVRALALYRELAGERPDEFAERHAGSALLLARLGAPWQDRGVRRDAADEAVRLYRRLSVRQPGRFAAELASALRAYAAVAPLLRGGTAGLRARREAGRIEQAVNADPQ